MKLNSIIPYLALLLLLLIGSPISSAIRPSTASSSGISIVIPSFEYYPSNDTASSGLNFQVFNTSSGQNISSSLLNCSIHVYNSSNSHVTRGFLLSDGEDMRYDLPNNITSAKGFYQYIVWCNSSGAYGWAESSFVMNFEGEGVIFDGGWQVALFICLIPVILSFFLLRWGDDLGEEHFAAKFGIKMFSLSLYFLTIYFAYLALLKYFIWQRMQNALGTTTYIIGGLFALLLFYFLINYIRDMFADINKKKRRED